MRIELVGNLAAPAVARDFVGEQLDRSPQGPAPWPREDIVLVASELVTNAVQAGAGVISVKVDLVADQLTLEVEDDAPGWPAPQAVQSDSVRGRGLAITEALADDWSVSRHQPVKVVIVRWRPGVRQP